MLEDLSWGLAKFLAIMSAYMAASSKGPRDKPKSKKTALPKSERRQQILSVARDVFARRGYHQTTIDDIALQAGVARGTFYLYFEDKRAVFSDLIDRFASQLTMAIVRIATDDPQRPVADQVRENIRAIIGTCLTERSMTKILFTDAVGIDPAFDRKLFTFYDTVVQLLAESLKDGQALGIVEEGEPRVLAYLTIGALKELLYQAVTLGYSEESAEVLTQQMYTFLAGGYLRVGPSKTPPRRRTR
jgi:AcrR family transcriptional regulator